MLLLFLIFSIISTAQAALYVTRPRFQSSCTGGQPCTVEYLDDGVSPLLPQIGLCEVGLYTGNQQLVQRIKPVDVSETFSFTFTPNPKAGPNSSNYYIALTSVSLKTENGTDWIGFSPTFSLDNMEGSFESPLPSATAAIPIPTPAGPKPSFTSTLTIGTLSTTRSMVTSRTGFSSVSAVTSTPSPSSPLTSVPQYSPSVSPSSGQDNSALSRATLFSAGLFFFLLVIPALRFALLL